MLFLREVCAEIEIRALVCPKHMGFVESGGQLSYPRTRNRRAYREIAGGYGRSTEQRKSHGWRV